MRTLVTGGTVVTASDTVAADVLIVDEQVAAVGIDVRAGAGVDRVVDATGRYVLPGGVDVHTHMELQTPYAVASDDFATGTAAAAWGGTTTIVDYAGHDYGEPLSAGRAATGASRCTPRPARSTCTSATQTWLAPASRARSTSAPHRCGQVSAYT